MIDPGETVGLAASLAAMVALVGFLVRWLVSQASADDKATQQRLAALEGKVDYLEKELSAQRSAKHQALNDLAASEGTIRVLRQLHGTLGAAAFHTTAGKLLDPATAA